MGNALYGCVRSRVSKFRKIKLLPGIGVFVAAVSLIILTGYAVSGAAGLNSGMDSSVVRNEITQQKSALSLPGQYVVIGWNDLGMHCINPDYATIALLPPFNNLWVQVIKRGDPPEIVTSGFTLDYAIANNTKVTGKTDFWKNGAALYAKLLGIPTPPAGVGLTGNRLSGTLTPMGDHFEATGIPVLPYDDKMNWNPYQIANIKLKNRFGGGYWQRHRPFSLFPMKSVATCAICREETGRPTFR